MKRSKTVGVFLLVIALAAAVASTAPASGSEIFTIRDSAGGPASEPAVGFDPLREEFLVVWNDLAAGDVMGQRVARRSGGPVLLGDAINISGYGAGVDAPSLAFSPDRRAFLVVWEEGGRVMGVRVGSGGAVLGSPMTIDPAGCGPDDPSVAYGSAAKRWLVVWRDTTCGSADRIRARRVRGSGSPFGPAYLLALGNSGVGETDVAYDSTRGRFLAVWDGSTGILGRRLEGTGAPFGSQLTIAAGSFKNDPSVVFHDRSGRFFVGWEDASVFPSQIQARFVRAGGTLVPPVQISSPGNNADDPGVAYNRRRNKLLTAWEQSPIAGSDAVYGQWTRPSGADQGGDFLISGAMTDEETPDETHRFSACSINRPWCLTVWEQGPDPRGIAGGFHLPPP